MNEENNKTIKIIRYKAGYEIRHIMMDGKPYGCQDFLMKSAFTPEGHYIGDPKTAYRLCKKRGIKPELISPSCGVCSIGFCKKKKKWYGWSHRAICGFGIGSKIKEDHMPSNGFPVGFVAKTLDDAKQMAIAFAKEVS